MAADIHVAVDGSAHIPYDTPATGLRSISQAIAYSLAGDRIVVGPGVFKERLSIPHDLSVAGSGMHRTIIDGDGGGSCVTLDRHVSAVLTDLTLRHGRSPQGGGIMVEEGHLALRRVRFLQCAAGRGGGLYAKSSTVSVVESVFDRCAAEETLQANGGKGGGCYLVGTPGGASAEFDQCRFSGNRGTYGGAVRLWTASATFRQTQFFGNRSEYDVIEASEFSSAWFVDCLAVANQSRRAGTLAYLNASGGGIAYATVSENRSLDRYSVLYADFYSVAQVWNSAFQANVGDGLDVPFGTVARGSVFSTPPFRLAGLMAQDGAFHAAVDGRFYLASQPGDASIFIAVGDPECPFAVDPAQRKIFAAGDGTSATIDAGYGYPFGTTAVVASPAASAWPLTASGSPMLDYKFEVSGTPGFGGGTIALPLGPLASPPTGILAQPIGLETEFYRIRGIVPENFQAKVTVTDPQGGPLANLRVDILDPVAEQWLGSGWSDAGGVATISNLPSGSFTALAGIDSLAYVPQYLGGTTDLATADRFTLGDHSPSLSRRVALALGAEMSVSVAAGTTPLAGAEVVVYRLDGQPGKRAATNAEGKVLIGGLAAGTYRLGASKRPEYADSFWQGSSTFAQANDILIDGLQTVDLSLDLVPQGRFDGTVYGADFEPLAGIFVVAYDSPTWAEKTYTMSNQVGAFSLHVPAGTYVLSAGVGSNFVTQYSAPTSVSAGGAVAGVEFFLVAGGSIAGNVHLADGTPAGNLFVDFYVKTGSEYVWMADAYVDTLGDFLSPLLTPATYYIQVYGQPTYSNSWYTGTGGSQPLGVNLAAGQIVMNIDIVVVQQ